MSRIILSGKQLGFCFLAWVALATSAGAVQNTWDYSVQVSATVQASPPTITLQWPQDTDVTPTSYTVYRKSPGASTWGSGTTLSGSSTSFSDTSVAAGAAYEYRIVKARSGFTGYGYIQTGVAAPLVDQRGKVVLIVDATMAAPLAFELGRLQEDLVGDGWVVIRHDVARSASVPSVKALIKSAYDADPTNVKSVFLFGHVPVPYSGALSPDGHSDHHGAWPADVFYGDMDGNWTDSSVNVTSTHSDAQNRARLTNQPGDGKFDQTQLPSTVELQVGRVDLANMTGDDYWGIDAVIPNETELLRRYLNKDHKFRHRLVNPARRALVGDYLGTLGSNAPAASGFRSFAPLVGASNVRNLTREVDGREGVWINETSANDYLLVSGSAFAGYGAINSLGSAGPALAAPIHEFIGRDARGVITLMFGSWHGDWDHADNVLRAPLATNHGLISVWSGRPHWFFHPMGLGETAGYVARLTQNNNGHYENQSNPSANRIHVALMGDPTIRLHPVVPPRNVSVDANGNGVALDWSASSDSNLVGYHVYRGASLTAGFTRLTSSPVSGTSFTDSSGGTGMVYQVRAIKLESTPSGSYYNASQAAYWNAGDSESAKIVGGAREVGSDIRHPNGNTYDQILLTGSSATVRADPGQVTRVSFIDLTNDIVQVEFSGAGTLSLWLENPSGPASPAHYNQPGVAYMKGHARMAISGANESTYVSVFSVGRINAVNQSLLRSDVSYDGLADLASIDIVSSNGKFGGVLAGNASFFATNSTTGVMAPGVTLQGALIVGDVAGFDSSRARLAFTRATDVRVAGGDISQPNGRKFGVSGITVIRFTAGTKSSGETLPILPMTVGFDVLDGQAWPIAVN